jgi:hypothetical protein
VGSLPPIIPGTTPERSAKALKRVRVDPVEPEYEYEEEDPADTWDMKPTIRRTASGEMKEFFTIKYLAQAWDNRTIQSIRKLERQGVLPRAKYRTTAGQRRDRLYSREQIETLLEIAKDCGVYYTTTRVNIAKTGFTKRLLDRW